MTSLNYDAIEIRHEPDGDLLAVFTGPTFDQEDIIGVLKKVLRMSNNFSVRGVHTLETHVSYDNNIKIRRDEK